MMGLFILLIVLVGVGSFAALIVYLVRRSTQQMDGYVGRYGDSSTGDSAPWLVGSAGLDFGNFGGHDSGSGGHGHGHGYGHDSGSSSSGGSSSGGGSSSSCGGGSSSSCGGGSS